MKRILGLLVMLCTHNPIIAQKIDEFIIGSWFDPKLSFTDREKDKATLDSLVAANFNILSGYNLTKNEKIDEFNYVLNILVELKSLKLMIKDHRFKSQKFEEDVHDELIENYYKLDPIVQQYLVGYHLGDEPPIENLDNINKWVNEYKRKQNEMETFIGLYPIYVGYDRDKYRKYIDKFCQNNSEIVAFNCYPFINKMMRGDYFWNLWVFSDVVKNYPDKKIWNIVYAIEHYFHPGPNLPITTRYDPVTKVLLKYVVHAPLIYGAKGIFYFTYESPGKDDWGAEFENAARENPYIYQSIKSINKPLKNVGAQLFSLNWMETVHGASQDNYSKENVPTVNINTPVIAEIRESNAAIGIFNDSLNQTHLLIMNKDTLRTRNIQIILKDNAPLSFFNASSNRWDQSTRRNYKWRRRSINVSLEPAEILLVRVGS